MVRTASTMDLPLGVQAPDFSLPDTEGRIVARQDFAGQPLLVMFLCNHCPFVKRVIDELGKLAGKYQAKGVGAVAIMSNDVAAYPDDAPPKMAVFKRAHGLPFPYLYDEDQTVAQAYRAACTPDFFLFDRDHRLVYRGQMDDSRPNTTIPVTGKDLRIALDAVVTGTAVPAEQKPSLGCNIKWKRGNEPAYTG